MVLVFPKKIVRFGRLGGFEAAKLAYSRSRGIQVEKVCNDLVPKTA